MSAEQTDLDVVPAVEGAAVDGTGEISTSMASDQPGHNGAAGEATTSEATSSETTSSEATTSETPVGEPPEGETPAGEAAATAETAASAPRQMHRFNPRRLIGLIPKPLRHALTAFVVLLIVMYLGVPALLNAKKSLDLLDSVNILWLIAGLLFEAAALVSYACLTRTLVPPDGPGLWTLFRIDMSTLAVSHLIPGGTASGTALGYRLLTSAGASGPDSGFAMASQGIGSAVVLNVLLWLALVISIPIAGFRPVYVTVALAGALLMAIFAALVYLLNKGEDAAARVLRAIAKPIPRLPNDKILAAVARVGTRIRLLGKDRAMQRRSVSWATANWLFDAASLWAFVAAFGHYISPVYLFVAYGVGNVLAAIPLTPAGVGFIESVVPAALVGFGLTKGVAYLAVIGWRLVNFWLPIPIGAGMYISLRVDRKRIKHVRAREAIAQLRTIPRMTSPVTAPVPITTAATTPPLPASAAGAEARGPRADQAALAEEALAEVTRERWTLRKPKQSSAQQSLTTEHLASEIAAAEAARRRLRNSAGAHTPPRRGRPSGSPDDRPSVTSAGAPTEPPNDPAR